MTRSLQKATTATAQNFALSIGCLLGIAARPFLVQPPSDIWVYSLVASDYDGYKLLPHFLAHYNDLGVPYSNFYLDVQHDPKEDNLGLRVNPRPVIKYHLFQKTMQETDFGLSLQ